ncbi:MAG: NAD(P)H-hydrate dehydratase, partial [Xanthomonadales bacterium]|nr:NAD(P)H-hydrate dehydratase [Xanthomonadales bacterium]
MQQLCLSDSTEISDVRLYTAAAVRELDRLAIEEYGLPGYTLMQRAGAFMFAQLLRRLAGVKPADCNWLVICGAGNNAGDGYIIAKLATEAGYQVIVVALHAANQLKGDAQLAAESWQQEYEIFDWQSFQSQLNNTHFDVCVDAILGTGLDRPLEGIYRDAVEWLNRQILVAAVDIPTGLSADTGAIASVAVNAAITCSFIGRKQGLYTADGCDSCGEIFFSDLSAPQQIFSQVVANTWLLSRYPEQLPTRAANSHKGSYGHVLLCGGQPGMSGAVMLTGEAALRAGAGMVTIATVAEHAGNINLARPELMVRATEDAAALELIARKADVLVIGPGLGTGEWGRRCLQVLLQLDTDIGLGGGLSNRLGNGLRPLVVDADGLNLLASQPVARGNWVLTPHPAEAARLLGLTTAEIQADRFAAV